MRMKQGHVAALAARSAAAIAHAGPSGSINGKVTHQGTPETPKPIDTSREPSYAKQHATPIMTEIVVTNALESVLVYVPSGSLDETMPASQPVRIDQKDCQHIRVVAFQLNQSLEIANDDKTSHSFHPLPNVKRESNKSQPLGPPLMTEKNDKPEFTKCNTHRWMRARFAVLKNSHYAVTRGEGSFTPPNLPEGKYTVTAWHESYGDQTQKSLLVMKRRRFSRLQSEAQDAVIEGETCEMVLG